MLELRIERDLEAALLARDKPLVSTLRAIKNAILYARVAANTRERSMPDEAVVVTLLQNEAKKRQESADLYRQGSNEEKARDELAKKAIIERYLPVPMTESKVAQLVGEVMGELGAQPSSAMGKVIAGVREKPAGRADGALIARLVREGLAP